MKRSRDIMRRRWFLPVLSGLLVALILLVVFMLSGYAPFGERSLTMFDADIQYLDFFAYLKDVLAGQNNIDYTFSKTLGGNNIAVFSYYLASPFSLLVVFFDKVDLISFFDVVVLLKLALTGVTMAVFLQERFSKHLKEFPKRRFFVPILAIGYALSQYPLAQSNGIMWLDAVYLLPLMLLGVYYLIKRKKSTFLTVTVALAILFNWYTGAIACIFTVGWFFFEYFLNNRRAKIRDFVLATLRFGLAMGFGVLISCLLFLPTIGALGSGNRSVLEIDRLLNFSFIESIIPGIIVKYRPGALSAMGYVSLYCGVLAAIGVVGSFLSSAISRRKKVWFGILLALTVLIFYWNPFVIIFSLLKNVDTYWYRYSFVGIFALIFLAAQFYLRKRPLAWRKPLCVVVGVVAVCDAGLNAYLIYDQYSMKNVASYRKYSAEAEEQFRLLKEYDGGTYRVSQTSNRGNFDNPFSLTPNYNEALAYDFWSISGYTSSPDDIQRNFLHRVGYHINGENMCITNASVLGVDSLLGVKYIWSEYPINGLERVEELGEYNEKLAYLNPFALPMAFTASVGELASFSEGTNPFEYQNELYSQLAGEKVEPYRKLSFATKEDGYILSLPKGNLALYANLEWNEFFDEEINVNGRYSQPYAKWLTPSVFYVPTKPGETEATIGLAKEDIARVRDPQFYALDLDVLKNISSSLQSVPEYESIKNGHVDIRLSGDSEKKLVTTIPADKGWEILRNGKRVTPELFGETFYTFSLEEGENHIEMFYHPPRLRLGMVAFGVGVVGAVGTFIFQRRRGRIRSLENEELTQDVV